MERNVAAGVATLFALCGIGSLLVGLQFGNLMDCSNNMRMIDSAKDSFGWEHRLSPGDRVLPRMVSPLLKGGWQALRCPSGGHYDPGLFVGATGNSEENYDVRCDVHGPLEGLERVMKGGFPAARLYFAISTGCILVAARVGFVAKKKWRP